MHFVRSACYCSTTMVYASTSVFFSVRTFLIKKVYFCPDLATSSISARTTRTPTGGGDAAHGVSQLTSHFYFWPQSSESKVWTGERGSGNANVGEVRGMERKERRVINNRLPRGALKWRHWLHRVVMLQREQWEGQNTASLTSDVYVGWCARTKRLALREKVNQSQRDNISSMYKLVTCSRHTVMAKRTWVIVLQLFRLFSEAVSAQNVMQLQVVYQNW
jgi:hypothetical protein